MGTFTTHYDSKDLINENVDLPGFGDEARLCQNCFNKIKRTYIKELPGEIGPTALLYLAPIFIGILGGILMYIAVKDSNMKMANNGVIIGVIFTFIGIIAYFVLFYAGLTSLGNLI